MTTDIAQFQIKHEQFEGPIEVLLELVEKRKLFVNDVSLAAVTDDFIAYIQQKGMHPEHVASFLSVAATLLLIKARSLLPNLELTSEESDSISDLERRLALYQIITEAAKWLTQKYGKKIAFEGVPRSKGVVFAPDPTLSAADLSSLVLGALVKVPPPKPKIAETRVYKTISLREVLDTLHERIQTALTTTFDAIAVHSPDADEKSKKVYVIVSFLGMLELVRRGLIEAQQEQGFGTISLSSQTQAQQVGSPDTSEYDE